MAQSISGEFLVSDDPASNGGSPSVAGHDDGSFLISWQGLLHGDDGGFYSNGSDILARAFTAEGPAGSVFRVNAEIRDGQYSPFVAARSDGSYVVAYSSGEENQLEGTFAASQVLGGSGSPIGTETFNNYTYYNSHPVVTTFADGRYVVVSTQEDDLEGQIHAADGTISSTFDFASVGRASIAQSGAEEYVVFWTGLQDISGDEPQQFGLYAQIRTLTGAAGDPILLLEHAPDGPRFDLNVVTATLADGRIALAYTLPEDLEAGTGPHDLVVTVFNPDTGAFDTTSFGLSAEGDQHNASIAAVDDGGFVLAWQDDGAGDGSGSGIRAQIFGADARARETSFIVNDVTEGNQFTPSVAAIGNDSFVVTWQGDGLRAATFSADPVVNAPGEIVNTTTDGSQKDSSVARLADGGFVIVWSDGSQDELDNRTDIRGQRYDANGHRVGGEFLVNSDLRDIDETPRVSAAADGGFTVAWIHGQDEFAPGAQPHFQRFAADGSKLGPEVSTESGYFQLRPEVVAMTQGRTLVTWQSIDEDMVYGRIFKPDGNLAGSFALETNLVSTVHDATVTKGGALVVTYAARSEFNLGDAELHVAVFNGNGVLLQDQLIAPTPDDGSDQRNPAVTALSNNGFVVTWQEGDAVLAQVYRSDWSKTGDVIEVATLIDSLTGDVTGIGRGASGHNPDITALADGRFVISWTDSATAAQTVHLQAFTVEGDRSGDEQILEGGVGDRTLDAALGGFGDSGFVLSFEDAGASGDGSGLAIRHATFAVDLLLKAADAGGVLLGSDASDTIYGAKGFDDISGGEGNDLIYAGKGDDLIHGGDGADRIYGGFQHDSIFGDDGDDFLFGEGANIANGSIAAQDAISGGAGADTIFGDALVIESGGIGGRDTLSGDDGADVIYGDAQTMRGSSIGANDIINGGAGNDILYGDAQYADAGVIGGNDRITGGLGDDILWGGGGNDQFLFGAPGFGNDVIEDFGQGAGNSDRIVLTGLGLSFGNLTIVYVDGDALITAAGFGPDSSIRIADAPTLHASDFIL